MGVSVSYYCDGGNRTKKNWNTLRLRQHKGVDGTAIGKHTKRRYLSMVHTSEHFCTFKSWIKTQKHASNLQIHACCAGKSTKSEVDASTEHITMAMELRLNRAGRVYQPGVSYCLLLVNSTVLSRMQGVVCASGDRDGRVGHFHFVTADPQRHFVCCDGSSPPARLCSNFRIV